MSTTYVMERATFPQPAGEIFIRPASEQSLSRSSSLSESEAGGRRRVSAHGGQLHSPSSPSLLPLTRKMSSSRKQQRHQNKLQIITDPKRGAPGDPKWQEIAQRTPEQARIARQRRQYYGEMFASRGPSDSFGEAASRDSVVVAEVKTNVILPDEYTFLTNLSAFLSARYTRPESSIVINLQHSTCVLFAGSFDPAYIVTISALPEFLTPTVNERNAMLLQVHMTEQIAVPAERGVVKFVPVADSCLASGGTTVLGAKKAAASEANKFGANTPEKTPRSTSGGMAGAAESIGKFFKGKRFKSSHGPSADKAVALRRLPKPSAMSRTGTPLGDEHDEGDIMMPMGDEYKDVVEEDEQAAAESRLIKRRHRLPAAITPTNPYDLPERPKLRGSAAVRAGKKAESADRLTSSSKSTFKSARGGNDGNETDDSLDVEGPDDSDDEQAVRRQTAHKRKSLRQVFGK